MPLEFVKQHNKVYSNYHINRIICNQALNYDHSSPIGCYLKFSHLIGPEGGFKFDGRKFQWL